MVWAGIVWAGGRVVEKVQAPIRCYESDDKPSDIFSWREGIYVGIEEEWAELRSRYIGVSQLLYLVLFSYGVMMRLTGRIAWSSLRETKVTPDAPVPMPDVA